MKTILSVFVVLATQATFASQLNCDGYKLNVRGTYNASDKEFVNVDVTYDESRTRYVSATYDSSFVPKGKNKENLAYRIMESARVRSGMTLLAPKRKGKKFRGILVGREHEYHGEATYEFMSCTLK